MFTLNGQLKQKINAFFSRVIQQCLWRKMLDLGYIDFLRKPGGIRAKLAMFIGCDCTQRVGKFCSPESNYQRFLLQHSFVCCLDRQRCKSSIEQWAHQPTVSILLPVYRSNSEHLLACLASVENQIYPQWQLCIVDDGSQQEKLNEILTTFANKHSHQVKLFIRDQNQGITITSQQALELADGEFIAMLDHDDCLAPEALYEVVKQLNLAPKTDWIYSDNDKLNKTGEHCCYHPKPCWSPELLLTYNYILHLSVIRKSLVEKVGGFRAGFEGSQDHDLYLRLSENTNLVKHIPKVLYHWRQSEDSVSINPKAKSYAYDAALKALNAALKRRGETGHAVHAENSWLGSYQINRTIKLTSLDVIWLDENTDEPLSAIDSSIDLVASAKKNFELNHHNIRTGALFCDYVLQSQSGYLLLCSKSIMITDPRLMERLAANLVSEKLIATSVKIVDLNGKVDHCGLAFDQQGHILYPLRGWDSSCAGHGAHGALPRNVELLSPLLVMFKRKSLLDLIPFLKTQTTIETLIATLCLKTLSKGLRLSVDGGLSVSYPSKNPYQFKLTDQQSAQRQQQYNTFFDSYDRFYPIYLNKEPANFKLRNINI